MHVNFLKSPVQLPKLSLNGEALQVVDHMKLLGLEIQNNLGWNIQVRNMISNTKQSGMEHSSKKHDFSAGRRLFILYTLRNFWAPVEDMLAVFQTYVIGPFWNTLALSGTLPLQNSKATNLNVSKNAAAK